MTALPSTILAAGLLASATAAQAATVIAADYTGTVSPYHAKDTAGLFGPKGASLAGKAIRIHTQYVPTLLPDSGECRNGICTYHQTQQGQTDVSGAVETSITINGKTVTYAPTDFAALYLGTGSYTFFTSDSDAISGFGEGLRGVQLQVTYEKPVAFGQPLDANGNAPVLNSASDYVYFFKPNSQTPVETINFGVTAANTPAR